jgi:hypothetical protein
LSTGWRSETPSANTDTVIPAGKMHAKRQRIEEVRLSESEERKWLSIFL